MIVQGLTAQLQERQAAPQQQAAPTAAEIFGQQSPRGDTPELVRPPDAAFFDQLIPPEAEAANHYTERGITLPPRQPQQPQESPQGDGGMTNHPPPQDLRERRLLHFGVGAETRQDEPLLQPAHHTAYMMGQEEVQTNDEVNADFQRWLESASQEDFADWLSSRRGNSPPATMAEASYLRTASRTFLPGHNSMLIDPGSRINIVGAETAASFHDTAATHGRETSMKFRPRLNVNGVGAGSAPSDRVATYGIACRYEGTVQHDTYTSNIVEGSGSQLPAILGLDSMEAKRGILVMEAGKQKLIFPGDGEVTMGLPAGSKVLPLEKSPSGHLVARCDEFEDVPDSSATSSGLATGPATAFPTEPAVPEAPEP